jgi:predicted MFS family arabinose efflux permease
MGAVVPTCLVYVGDAVPLDRRQHTLTDLNAATATGITFATALGGVLAATVSWRAAFAVPAVGAALVALLLRRLPEPTRPVVAQTGVLTVLRHRWGRRVLALTLVEGAVLLGLLAYLAPALQSTGESATTAGLVVALYGVGLLLASRVVKRQVARTAPRVLLGVGAALLVAAYAVTAVSRSELAVGATALLVGFGWAPLHSTMQTWATEVVPQARAAMVSLFAAMLFLGGGLATAVLAPFAGQQRWTPMFAVAALVTAGFGVVAVLVRGRYHRPAVS